MKKRILLLGGYGGVGRPLARLLLEETDVDIVIAGRNEKKAKDLAAALQLEFPKRIIEFAFADASNKASLLNSFKGASMVVVTSTTPDWADQIADAAMECGADYLDIFFRSDVVDKLQVLEQKAKEKGRLLITQAGFHPGLIAPMIKAASYHFDSYDTAEVSMAMNAKFEKAESALELIYETGVSKPAFLKNGEWKIPTYKDIVKVSFSERFGTRDCYPIPMRELFLLEKELGIRNMGCYAAGFNWFVDYLVFPLIMVVQSIKRGLGATVLSRLLVWGNNAFYKDPPGIELRLMAIGKKDGKAVKVERTMFTDDAYGVTGQAVITYLKQYLNGQFKEHGLFLMGNLVEPQQVMEDLRKMGVEIEERVLVDKSEQLTSTDFKVRP